MKKILFVDDEQLILDGISNMLWRRRKDWEIKTVTSGAEALEIISNENYDVVCSDMRMPGMNGAELLEKVCEISPGTVRIMLTGQASKDHFLRATPYAHQFLPQPCSRNVLDGRLLRVLREVDAASVGEKKAEIIGYSSLPALSAHHGSQWPEENDKEVVINYIQSDVTTCLTIIRFANSAYISPNEPITNVRDALQVLDMNLVKLVVMSVRQNHKTNFSIELSQFIDEEINFALGKAQLMAKLNGHEITDDFAYTLGAFSCIGNVLLASCQQEKFETDSVQEFRIDRHELFENSEISAHDYARLYLSIRGIPKQIVDLVAPTKDMDIYDDADPLHCLVYAVDQLSSSYLPNGAKPLFEEEPHGLDGNPLPAEWHEFAQEIFEGQSESVSRRVA